MLMGNHKPPTLHTAKPTISGLGAPPGEIVTSPYISVCRTAPPSNHTHYPPLANIPLTTNKDINQITLRFISA